MCRDASKTALCDEADVCDGVSAKCEDRYKPKDTICSPAIAPCIAASKCTYECRHYSTTLLFVVVDVTIIVVESLDCVLQ
jgi:hypothetical protein